MPWIPARTRPSWLTWLTISTLFVTVSSSLYAADQRLVDAASRADWVTVQKHLSAEAVASTQVDGTTALHWAAHHNRADVVATLLQVGASATAATQYGVTPLQVACIHGNADIIKALIAAGADANQLSVGREPMLLLAARSGRHEAVRVLLDHGAKVNATSDAEQTALMWAAADGHDTVVKTLLAAGADLTLRTPSGFSALLFAARAGHRQAVEVLLAAKADANDAIPSKKAGKRGPTSGTSALLLAMENGHFELAIRLVEAGADPNDERSGYTPLHTISWVRKPNRGDFENGKPPPQPSGTMTSLAFVRELVARGAKVDQPLGSNAPKYGTISLVGATPVFFAALRGDLPLATLLVDLGADPLRPTTGGSTPLMAAAGIGSTVPEEEAGIEPEFASVVRYLIGLGADVNTVDRNQETAMHGAAYKNFPSVVQLLAEHRADISLWNRKNKSGWTPLLIAEGFRPGNFKPSESTIVAIRSVMTAAGVTPPPPTPRPDAAKPLAKDKNYPPQP